MSAMTLKALVAKLNSESKRTLEAAAALCSSRSHFSVEISHWLRTMLDGEQGDLHCLLRHASIDAATVKAQLNKAMESLKTGNNSAPGLSPQLVEWMRKSWLLANLEFGSETLRTGHLLLCLLKDDLFALTLDRLLPGLEAVEPSEIEAQWSTIFASSSEQGEQPGATAAASGDALSQFTQDLTADARAGKLDPILGRDGEIRQMIDILTRRRQNNPILTGEAGVGKTAVVEGLALRIAAGDVPQALHDVAIRVLDLALLQAGAGMKGEFENRLKSVIAEVKASPTPIILFIDEAHTLIGSGGAAGQNDAANLLKPALARGELRTIAATTWAEYKKFFEKDAALTRRFQVVKVEEPDEATAVLMMGGLLPVMEAHHGVTISADALRSAVALSNRYIHGRQLPDKAVALLDTACARVAMSQAAVPGELEDCTRQIDALQREIEVHQREQKMGQDNHETLAHCQQALADAEARRADAEMRWRDEKSLVVQAAELAQQLLADEDDVEVLQQARQRLQQLRAQLDENETPMVHWQVDHQVVASVVSDWTGVPLGRMRADELKTVSELDQRLAERVVGQDHVLSLIAQTVRNARVQLTDEKRPNGVFMLAGPSGVGKTETALALAELIYGSEDKLTTINMSEFKEEHKVSLLLGSPPGYVGYGEGGVLTEAVRRKPYSVVLLDEMEKAHPGVQEIFYQVFDKGTIKDGEGRDIDFKNTTIIMTSNVGSETTLRLFEDPATAPSIDGLQRALQDDLSSAFKPAFLGRVKVLPFTPLDEQTLAAIAKLQLQRVSDRLQQHHGAQLDYDDAVVAQIVSTCRDAGTGARTILNSIENKILPNLSAAVLDALAEQKAITQVTIVANDGDYACNLQMSS